MAEGGKLRPVRSPEDGDGDGDGDGVDDGDRNRRRPGAFAVSPFGSRRRARRRWSRRPTAEGAAAPSSDDDNGDGSSDDDEDGDEDLEALDETTATTITVTARVVDEEEELRRLEMARREGLEAGLALREQQERQVRQQREREELEREESEEWELKGEKHEVEEQQKLRRRRRGRRAGLLGLAALTIIIVIVVVAVVVVKANSSVAAEKSQQTTTITTPRPAKTTISTTTTTAAPSASPEVSESCRVETENLELAHPSLAGAGDLVVISGIKNFTSEKICNFADDTNNSNNNDDPVLMCTIDFADTPDYAPYEADCGAGELACYFLLCSFVVSSDLHAFIIPFHWCFLFCFVPYSLLPRVCSFPKANGTFQSSGDALFGFTCDFWGTATEFAFSNVPVCLAPVCTPKDARIKLASLVDLYGTIFVGEENCTSYRR